jgi:3-hydroxybutyryl-CoA dehydrogenase
MSQPTPLRIAVLGAGQMGSGIALLLAEAGHAVTLWDAFPAVASGVAASFAEGSYSSPSKRRGSGSVTGHADLASTVTGVDIVFEAIAEDLAAKHAVYTAISALNPTCIVASNTSSLPTAELVKGVTVSPGRFAIAHFFNPPRIVPLVEIVPCTNVTEARVLDTLVAVLADAGKLPVRLAREVPGFVANRLQAALLREAFALVADGVATFEDVDTVVRAGLAARWAAAGPMMVTDLGGLDIWKAVTTQLFPLLCTSATPPEAITSRVDQGLLGAKTGQGLYVHDAQEDERIKERIAAHFHMDFGDK